MQGGSAERGTGVHPGNGTGIDPDVKAEEAEGTPLVGDKEPVSALASEYQSSHSTLIMRLGERYPSIRRIRADGSCFFRSFVFSYLEHNLETEDMAEAVRTKRSIEECTKDLEIFGYAGSTLQECIRPFTELLDNAIQGKEKSMSAEELLHRSRDQVYADSVEVFSRHVTSAEKTKQDYLKGIPDVDAVASPSYGRFDMDIHRVMLCRISVNRLGRASDDIHISALSNALGVAIRIVCLDTMKMDVHHHDIIPAHIFIPAHIRGEPPVDPFINLLHRSGRYDILYRK